MIQLIYHHYVHYFPKTANTELHSSLINEQLNSSQTSPPQAGFSSSLFLHFPRSPLLHFQYTITSSLISSDLLPPFLFFCTFFSQRQPCFHYVYKYEKKKCLTHNRLYLSNGKLHIIPFRVTITFTRTHSFQGSSNELNHLLLLFHLF